MLSIAISNETRVSDMRAFLDSYMVELTRDGKTYLCAPVFTFATLLGLMFPNHHPQDPYRWTGPPPTLKLLRWGPTFADLEREPETRWKFYVHHEMTVQFRLPVRLIEGNGMLKGEYKWTCQFEQCKRYEEMELKQDRPPLVPFLR